METSRRVDDPSEPCSRIDTGHASIGEQDVSSAPISGAFLPEVEQLLMEVDEAASAASSPLSAPPELQSPRSRLSSIKPSGSSSLESRSTRPESPAQLRSSPLVKTSSDLIVHVDNATAPRSTAARTLVRPLPINSQHHSLALNTHQHIKFGLSAEAVSALSSLPVPLAEMKQITHPTIRRSQYLDDDIMSLFYKRSREVRLFDLVESEGETKEEPGGTLRD